MWIYIEIKSYKICFNAWNFEGGGKKTNKEKSPSLTVENIA